MKNIISNMLACLWFFCVLIWVVLLIFLAILMVLFSDIIVMLKSGFATQTVGFMFCFVFGFILAITGWVPAFRRCYYKLPWLYPLCSILYMNLFILSISEAILAKGFQVISTPRHIATIVIMVIQMIVCRIAMCIYLKKKPLIIKKGEWI